MFWQVISRISTDRHVLSSVLVWWYVSTVSVSMFECRHVLCSVLVWWHVSSVFVSVGCVQVLPRAAFRCCHVLYSVLVWCHVLCSVLAWCHVSPVFASVLESPRAVFSIDLVSRKVSPLAVFRIGLVARIPHIRIWFLV